MDSHGSWTQTQAKFRAVEVQMTHQGQVINRQAWCRQANLLGRAHVFDPAADFPGSYADAFSEGWYKSPDFTVDKHDNINVVMIKQHAGVEDQPQHLWRLLYQDIPSLFFNVSWGADLQKYLLLQTTLFQVVLTC